MTFDIVQFCKDWNAGVPAKDIAGRYELTTSVVQSRVNSLRKKGVNLRSRRGGTGALSLTEQEIALLNKQLEVV